MLIVEILTAYLGFRYREFFTFLFEVPPLDYYFLIITSFPDKSLILSGEFGRLPERFDIIFSSLLLCLLNEDERDVDVLVLIGLYSY